MSRLFILKKKLAAGKWAPEACQMRVTSLFMSYSRMRRLMSARNGSSLALPRMARYVR